MGPLDAIRGVRILKVRFQFNPKNRGNSSPMGVVLKLECRQSSNSFESSSGSLDLHCNVHGYGNQTTSLAVNWAPIRYQIYT